MISVIVVDDDTELARQGLTAAVVLDDDVDAFVCFKFTLTKSLSIRLKLICSVVSELLSCLDSSMKLGGRL